MYQRWLDLAGGFMGICHKKVYFQSSNEVLTFDALLTPWTNILLEGRVRISGDNHGICLQKAYEYGKPFNILQHPRTSYNYGYIWPYFK